MFLEQKKAQAWGFDLMVAIIIFSVGIIIFFIYSLNQPSQAKENLEKLSYDGKLITNSLLSEGHPDNWIEDDVISIGILNNNKINETKLERFYDFAQNNYSQTKRTFNTIYDYYFFLDEDMDINGVVEGIGLVPNNPKNLIKITRYVIYKDEPMTAYIYVFEE